MPLKDDQLMDVKKRIYSLVMEIIQVLRLINENSADLFGRNSPQVSAAITEYLRDFIDNTNESGQAHPERLIFETSRARFQNAGLYGAQLNLKEGQVKEANRGLIQRISDKAFGIFRMPFKKWVDVINNFLRSVTGATGLSEALMELKDCLRDQLPDAE